MSAVTDKLSAARTRLILDKPFLGALVLRLPLVEADPAWCPTTATDARSLYYSHDYIDQLTLGQVQFVLAHEALHCGLSHFARREHRDRRRWDVACDYAVNPLLTDDGLQTPPGTLLDERFAGMTAEEIYHCIDDNNSDQPMDQHIYDGPVDDGSGADGSREAGDPEEIADGRLQGDRTCSSAVEESEPANGASQPLPLSGPEREQLDMHWQQRITGAAQQAMQVGKLGGSIARMLEHLLRPSVPWRNLLAHYMSGFGRDDYDLMRPSRRREGDAILPSLHKRNINVAVALDTSGSIHQEEMDTFLTEINAIKGQVSARIVLVACDADLHDDGPWIFETWQHLKLPISMQGGGGTDFRPVFNWLESQYPAPDLLVYFTDANGKFPARKPAIPTLWLVKGRSEVPWGQRIQLN